MTRPHGDIDWIVARRELDPSTSTGCGARFRVARYVWGEAAPGEPFYLSGDLGDLRLEAGVADDIDGSLYLRVYSVAFDIDGKAPAVGYRVRLPDDTFAHPPIEFEGIGIRVASPCFLYQLRTGIASRGTFGPLSERQLETMSELRARFLPDCSDDELLPPVEAL